MRSTRHLFRQVDGHTVFYREAGHADAPAVVLLHGAPASSHMFRDLIPRLADRYHVIAPDLLGFGLSESPTVDEFDYTFDTLTDIVAALLADLGITRYAIYVQDYGAPTGWRLALRDPAAVTAIITQSGNAYEEGFVPSFWEPLWTYAKDPSEKTEAPLRQALTLDLIKWQYIHGVPDPALVSPDAWLNNFYALQRPGNIEVQLKLFREYPTNVQLYPQVQEYFRTSRVPLLAVWGRNDPYFLPAGAHAYRRDLPEAEVHLYDTGHFALETHATEIAVTIAEFLQRRARA